MLTDTPFYQQKLKAWQPILTPKWVVATFLVVGVIFIPLGFVLKGASDSVRRAAVGCACPAVGRPRPLTPGARCVLFAPQVVESMVQYGGDGAADEGNAACMLGNPGSQRWCMVNVPVPEDMEPPVYVYYQLTDFYQNHRRYVKSRDDSQLLGNVLPAGDLSDCDPLLYSPTNPSKVLHPCGLIANSFFNGEASRRALELELLHAMECCA